MARPKRDPDKKPAFERIEDAFWDILSEKPFDKITISELSKRAGVNHNLLYFYFDGIEDMARKSPWEKEWANLLKKEERYKYYPNGGIK